MPSVCGWGVEGSNYLGCYLTPTPTITKADKAKEASK